MISPMRKPRKPLQAKSATKPVASKTKTHKLRRSLGGLSTNSNHSVDVIAGNSKLGVAGEQERLDARIRAIQRVKATRAKMNEQKEREQAEAQVSTLFIFKRGEVE